MSVCQGIAYENIFFLYDDRGIVSVNGILNGVSRHIFLKSRDGVHYQFNLQKLMAGRY